MKSSRQLCLRSRSSTENQFARLSPRVAQELFEQAVIADVEIDDESTKNANGWRASSAPVENDASTGIGFLPLEITLGDRSIIYVSHNGGTLVGDDEDSIELSEDTLPVEFFGDLVEVKALSFVPDATSLTMEPLTTEDWELLELYADFLESGSLLSQVSLVYHGQILTLSVGGKARVRVIDDANAYVCRRLLADTEITVVPKPRPAPTSPSSPLRLVGTSDDWSNAMKDLLVANHLDAALRVSPGCIMIHPETLENRLPGYASCIPKAQHAMVWRADNTTGPCTLVSLQVSERIPRDTVALHVLNRYSIEATPLIHSVQVQLLPSGTLRRIRQRTLELLEQSENQLVVETVTIRVHEDDQPSFWRDVEHSVAPFPDAASFVYSLSDDKILLTGKSVFVFSTTDGKYLTRLEVKDFDVVSNNSAAEIRYKTPTIIVSAEEVRKLCHFSGCLESSIFYPRIEQQITLMPRTTHCNMSTFSWPKIILQNKESVDAIILQGDVGTGKTHNALVLAALYRMKWAMPTLYVDCKKLQSAPDLRMNSILQEITATFRQAHAFQPSFLILDDLDCIAGNPNEEGSANDNINQSQANPVEADQSKLIGNHIQTLMEISSSTIFLAITCRSVRSLAPEITEYMPCHDVCELGTLNATDRILLLKAMLELDDGDSLEHFAPLTEGYRAHDLKVLATRVKHVPCTHSKEFEDTLFDAVSYYVPLARQGLVSEVKAESADWSDVGGLFEAKDKLKRTILDPIKYRRIYEKAPIQLPRGILLFGPPGCGKSFVVPAVAKECGYTLITCRGPELLDRYIGASEANVRQLFERARSAAPSILFLDEFDALAPRRGTDHTGVTDRVVNQLLTYLDGVETLMENVFIIAATSRPDKIDPALLRPGRLEQHIFVGFPESSLEVSDLIVKIMARRNVDPSLILSLKNGAFLWSKEETNLLRHMSPADFKAVLDTAHLQVIHEHLASPTSHTSIEIGERHFRHALLSTRPSVSEQDRAMFDEIYSPFHSSSREAFEKETSSQKLRTAFK